MAALTREQSAAALADDRAVAVVAGAGTGKTRVLTERYVDLVLRKGVEIPRILAVTFTEKAAREMKERIRGALGGKGRIDLARKAEFAPVSTIHAFLARTLRERALDAGIDPRFVVADEITSEFLREEAIAETIDSLPADRRDALVELAGAEDDLRTLYEAARATPLAMSDLHLMAPDLAALSLRMARFLEDCDGAVLATGGTATKLQGLRESKARFLALDPAAAAEFADLTKGNVGAAHRDLFKEGKEIAKAYLPLRHLERAGRTGAAVVAALEGLDDLYTAKKRAEGLLDFADLEREGLLLLRSPAGDSVLSEYDHVLVDEYQDTNRLQEAILDRLTERAVRFGVGDEKQSIYRFRHADAAVFQELREKATPYPLGGSFRARPELLAFTNALFRDLFAGTDVAPQDLRAEAPWREKRAPCVELIAPPAGDLAEGRRREATAIARRLKEIVDTSELDLTRADRPAEKLRYRHCAILLRATTNLVLYERALVEAGVPYVVIQGRGYYAAREVVDLAHLLLLLADPGDGYRAVAAMTSLFCGVPDGDLLHLPGDGPLPLRALGSPRPPPIPPERWERLRGFAARFQRWRAMAERVSTGDLVEAILHETRFAELMLLEPDGRRRYANLRKALRRARQSTEDFGTFGRSLLEFRERELRESEAPVAAEDDDAVKIMTIHAAKGLEFPLTVVADLSAGKRGGGRGPILRASDGSFSFRLRGEEESVEPPGHAELKAWDARQEAAEETRLLYVALTRAQEHMILSGALARADNVLGRLVAEPPEGVRVVDTAPLVRRAQSRGVGPAVRAAIRRRAELPAAVGRDEEAARGLLARLDEVRRPAPDSTPYVAAAADLVEFERCPRRYRLQRMLGIELEEPPEGDERPDADEHPRREIGTAFHEIMEKEGPGVVPDEALVRRYFPPAGPREIEKIRRWCAWLSAQPIAGGLGDREVRKEMPFLVRIGGLAIRGKIDLYAKDPPLLLDWKTGERVRTKEYEVQVAVYLAALRALKLPAPDRASLVYVDAQKIVEVKEEPVAPLIAAFKAAHKGGGRFAPKPSDACFHCEFRSACIRDGVDVRDSPTLFE